MPDMKITVSLPRSYGSSDPFRTDVTTYLQSDRKRVDQRRQLPQQSRYRGPVLRLPQPRLATITRCDLGKVFQLNLDDREYSSRPIPKPLSEEQRKAAIEKLRQNLPPEARLPQKPTLLIEISTVDTGERRQMFGRAARHVITTEKRTPLEGSSQMPQETVTDGWYTDLDTSLSCDPPRPGNAMLIATGSRPLGAPREVPSVKFIGRRETGFALSTIRRQTASQPEGANREVPQAVLEGVTDISIAPLSPSLFEIPAGFREVRGIRLAVRIPWWGQALIAIHNFWMQMERALTGSFRRAP